MSEPITPLDEPDMALLFAEIRGLRSLVASLQNQTEALASGGYGRGPEGQSGA